MATRSTISVAANFSMATSQREQERAAIIREGVRLVDLWEASPVRIKSNKAHTEEIVDALFPGDPLLCGGLSNSKFDTRSREEWRGQLSKLQLIVPSPMTARSGLTQDGKQSAHALSITGPRRFLVVEFDQGNTDEHAALFRHLGRERTVGACGPQRKQKFARLVSSP